jgi:hypothetical protein
MIDFKNSVVFKLSLAAQNEFSKVLTPLLLDDEQVLGSFKAIRDGIVFTTKRIIAINVQGITGKKKDFTSLPYSKIQAFSVETADSGLIDWDSEVELWFSGLGKVKFEFTRNTDVAQICKIISTFTL